MATRISDSMRLIETLLTLSRRISWKMEVGHLGRTPPTRINWRHFRQSAFCTQGKYQIELATRYVALRKYHFNESDLISAIFNCIFQPFGLIGTYWGGTRIEPWSPPESLEICNVDPSDPSGDPEDQNSYLYNAMIHPFIKMTIKGVLWYQGKSQVILLWINRWIHQKRLLHHRGSQYLVQQRLVRVHILWNDPSLEAAVDGQCSFYKSRFSLRIRPIVHKQHQQLHWCTCSQVAPDIWSRVHS